MTSLLHLSNGEHAAGQFSEVSLAKGRVYLNNMMYDAWLQLDQIEVSCKEFEESNRMVFSQVVTDLEHLGSDLADKERMKAEAEVGIADMPTLINILESSLKSLKRNYQLPHDSREERVRAGAAPGRPGCIHRHPAALQVPVRLRRRHVLPRAIPGLPHGQWHRGS